jgi:hypothetical protein
MKSTNTAQFIEDLDGGQFEADLGKILTAVGIAACDHDGPGEITIKLKMKRIGQSNQVNINHRITYSAPTSRGQQSESTGGETAMYVSATQGMTFFPSRENQGSLIGKGGEVHPGGNMPPR